MAAVLNPRIDARLALEEQPAPFRSPGTGDEASSPSVNEGEHLSMLIRYFEESESATQRARELSERDRDYHDNFDDDQWSEKEKAMLRRRGQPVITSNYIKRKVATLT